MDGFLDLPKPEERKPLDFNEYLEMIRGLQKPPEKTFMDSPWYPISMGLLGLGTHLMTPPRQRTGNPIYPLIMAMGQQAKRKERTLDDITKLGISTYPQYVEVMTPKREKPFSFSPGSTVVDPNTNQVWQAPAAPLTPGKPPTQRTQDLPGGLQQQQEWRQLPSGEWGWENVGKPVERWRESQGMSVSLPDGTTVSVGGTGHKTMSGLGTAAQTEVEKGLLSATELRRSLADIEKSFQPKFLTYGGQIDALMTKIKGKAGYELSPKENQYMNDFVTFRSAAAQNVVERLKAMSGVAITPQEYERNLLYLPNPGTGITDGDSPQELQAKLKRFTKFTNSAIARLNYIRKHGFSIQNVPLDRMDTIINQRASEIEAQYKKQNLAGKELTNKVKAQLAIEFGLVQ